PRSTRVREVFGRITDRDERRGWVLRPVVVATIPHPRRGQVADVEIVEQAVAVVRVRSGVPAGPAPSSTSSTPSLSRIVVRGRPRPRGGAAPGCGQVAITRAVPRR